MSSSEQGRRTTADVGLGELVASLSRDVQELVTGQIELAKAELRASAKSALTGGGLFAGAALLAVFGMTFLFLTIGFALAATGLALWLSFLIVTLLLLGTGGLLALLGVRRMRRVKGPERTIAAAKATGEALNQLKAK